MFWPEHLLYTRSLRNFLFFLKIFFFFPGMTLHTFRFPGRMGKKGGEDMAVGLWAVRLDGTVPEEMVRRMWENLPPRRRGRLERQKSAEKALEALAAYWILRRAVEEQYHWSGTLPAMAWTDSGKPFFPGEPAVHFSLSHTPGGVLVGLSALPLGVDLERMRPVHPRLLARTGCADEADFMAGWVRREARAKRLGTPVELGAETPLGPEERLWQEEVFPGYRACACYTEGGRPRLCRLRLEDTF